MLTSEVRFVNFYPFNDIETISPRPLLFITGDQAHPNEFSEDVYKRATEPKRGNYPAARRISFGIARSRSFVQKRKFSPKSGVQMALSRSLPQAPMRRICVEGPVSLPELARWRHTAASAHSGTPGIQNRMLSVFTVFTKEYIIEVPMIRHRRKPAPWAAGAPRDTGCTPTTYRCRVRRY